MLVLQKLLRKPLLKLTLLVNFRWKWQLGMNDSREFAGELFDALARRRGITSASITKDELREFWEQITDQSFDSRLQTFFDM